MRRPLKLLVLTVALPALLLPRVAGAADAPMHDRIYLLGADTDYLYWSVDPADPELGMARVTRACGAGNTPWGIPEQSKPCLAGISGTNRTYNLFFLPASLFDEPVTWSSADPLRFHLEASIDTKGVPFTVQLVVQKNTSLVVSPDATQVSPGVWEGQLTSGGPLSSADVNFFTLRVTTQAPSAEIELKAAGRSYIQLPRPFAGRGVPEMMREDVYHPQPTSYTSATHTFTFNDANWSATTFTGQTGPPKEFEHTVDRNAAMVIAWIELYDTPFVQDLRRGRPTDTRKLTRGASVSLLREGELLDHSGRGQGNAGWGVESVAVPNLPAGPLTVRVDSSDLFTNLTCRVACQPDPQAALPYTVHVLTVGGQRTISTLRTRWLQENAAGRLPVAAVCPPSPIVVPATGAVRTMGLDLDWDTEAVGVAAWTLRFSMPNVGDLPCSEAGTGDRVRLTVPGERVWYVSATPAYDATFVTAHDTVFELTTRYTYSPTGP